MCLRKRRCQVSRIAASAEASWQPIEHTMIAHCRCGHKRDAVTVMDFVEIAIESDSAFVEEHYTPAETFHVVHVVR